MIVVRLTGGLGNQMFQYAAAKDLSMKLNTALRSDLSHYSGDELRRYELNCFQLELPEVSEIEINKIRSSFSERKWSKVWKNIFAQKNSFKLLKQPNFYFKYYSAIEEATSNTYLDGYWQSEKYFKKIEERIREDFKFKKNLLGKNRELFDSITSQNAVSIHVRRGDYVANDITKEFHGACSLDYYQKSIAYLQTKIENPSYFIFSDDPVWVMENLKLEKENLTIVNNNKGVDSYEDMRLMSSCKHNIIANSSFSWWGAWLNTNPEKIVIAPLFWFNSQSKWFKEYGINTEDLLPKDWIKISNL